MKFKFFKRFSAFALCFTLIFTTLSSVRTLSNSDHPPILGGAYVGIREYRDNHMDNKANYEYHHLISREALTLWGNTKNQYSEFLVHDLDQEWVLLQL